MPRPSQVIFVEIANFTSEMSPAFNLFQCGQYGNLWLIGAALLRQAAELPLLPWHQASAQAGGKIENQNHRKDPLGHILMTITA